MHGWSFLVLNRTASRSLCGDFLSEEKQASQELGFVRIAFALPLHLLYTKRKERTKKSIFE